MKCVSHADEVKTSWALEMGKNKGDLSDSECGVLVPDGLIWDLNKITTISWNERRVVGVNVQRVPNKVAGCVSGSSIEPQSEGSRQARICRLIPPKLKHFLVSHQFHPQSTSRRRWFTRDVDSVASLFSILWIDFKRSEKHSNSGL